MAHKFGPEALAELVQGVLEGLLLAQGRGLATGRAAAFALRLAGIAQFLEAPSALAVLGVLHAMLRCEQAWANVDEAWLAYMEKKYC